MLLLLSLKAIIIEMFFLQTETYIAEFPPISAVSQEPQSEHMGCLKLTGKIGANSALGPPSSKTHEVCTLLLSPTLAACLPTLCGDFPSPGLTSPSHSPPVGTSPPRRLAAWLPTAVELLPIPLSPTTTLICSLSPPRLSGRPPSLHPHLPHPLCPAQVVLHGNDALPIAKQDGRFAVLTILNFLAM